jgi:ethanolamine permease
VYQNANEDYLALRELRRHARVMHLWALGVGAVISGDFFGWNFGLVSGGFGGMLFALCIMTAMYFGLCLSIAEMAAALPHTGGAYSFARAAMGPWGGYITGLAENMEYILTPAVIVVGIGGYLGAIFNTPPSWAPMWWLICYVLFVSLNIWGVELSFRFSVAITLAALAVLLVFWVGAIPHLDLARWAGSLTPSSWRAVLGCLPFALWFYLAIEQLPLAAEEAHDPRRDLPRGLLSGLLTLVVCAFSTLFTSAGMAPGAEAVGKSQEPLFLGFQTIFGTGTSSRLLAAVACTGLIASFHTIIFAYGRQIYSLSRAGYFPSWMSVTHAQRKTPNRALIAGAVLGYAAALVIHLAGQGSAVGAVLINMAVFGAVLAYILQMLSFYLLRRKYPTLERPYVSPLGMPGAILAAIIAAVTLGTLFVNPDYNKGVIGAAVWFIAGVAYFALYARKKLILAPEEEFARKLQQ